MLIKCPVCKAQDGFLTDKNGNYIEIDGEPDFDLHKGDLRGKCSVCKRIIKFTEIKNGGKYNL